jgi:hypothetical protein
LRHPHGALDVGGPHRGGEAVLGVVGQAHRLVLVGERHGDEHRSEDLLAGDRHVVAGVGEQRRGHEVAGRQVALAALPAAHQAGALLLAAGDVAEHALELPRVDQR